MIDVWVKVYNSNEKKNPEHCIALHTASRSVNQFGNDLDL